MGLVFGAATWCCQDCSLEGRLPTSCKAAAARAAPLPPSTSHDIIADKEYLTMA